MAAIRMAPVSSEDEAEATVTATKTETGETHHEVPGAAHPHPAALADPTSHRANHVVVRSKPLQSSRRKRRPTSK
jgi:hypothetical protein